MKKITMAFAIAFGVLALPALSFAQTYNVENYPAFGQAGMMQTMPKMGQNQFYFQKPVMGQAGMNVMRFETGHSYDGAHLIIAGITLLMLWILMALAIVWLATHLKKNLHKKE